MAMFARPAAASRLLKRLVVPVTVTSFRRHSATRQLGYAAQLGLLLSAPTVCFTGMATALCDSTNPDDRGRSSSSSSIFDTLFPKDNKGNVHWDQVPQQATNSLFWDKLAKAAGQKVQGALDSGVPTHLTYGFACGFCSGMALKKVGRAASVVLGLGFVTLQTLSYYGYVKVDHGQLQKDFHLLLDRNKDGQVDADDGRLIYNDVLKVLQFNIPAGGGFVAGFVGGFRSG